MVRGGRTLFVLTITGIALFGLSPSAAPRDLGGLQSLSAQEQSLLQAINQARAARGVPPLRVGVRLRSAARAHSWAMAQSGAFTHGNWYWRLRRHGVRARTLGETIGWGAGADGTASAIVSMWLGSPPHRATMLNPGFRRIGVGVAVGTMGGLPRASVATADFAG
ncbi:MAG TPA: CAP domain-containing protein [Gaiellaceae bacterium]|nr:CAP domain-containing protein [Gaiellaceae bacterium]